MTNNTIIDNKDGTKNVAAEDFKTGEKSGKEEGKEEADKKIVDKK